MKHSESDKLFTTPEGYFDNLNERLKKIGNQAENTNNFKVPDGYFENLNSRLSGISRNNLNRNRKNTRFAAAVIVVLAGLCALVFNQVSIQPQTTEPAFDVSTEEAAYYLSNYDMIEHAEIFEPYIEEEIIPVDGSSEFYTY